MRRLVHSNPYYNGKQNYYQGKVKYQRTKHFEKSDHKLFDDSQKFHITTPYWLPKEPT